MAGGLFSRLKVWLLQDSVYSTDLNGEIDNVISNMRPDKIDNYSHSVGEMQTTRSPGSVGSESLATSLADEIASLRYMFNQVIGGAQWYSSPSANLSSLYTAVGSGGSPLSSRLQSGAIDGNNQPMFLQASGSVATLTVLGASTNLKYYVNGTLYTVSSNLVSSTMTTAPSSNNTATTAANFGAYDTEIALSTPGSSITALAGKYAAFKLGSEYFIARVNYYAPATTYVLDNCQRGVLFDSANSNIASASGSSGVTVTLMKLVWVFLSQSQAITPCYNNPSYSGTAPTSPSNGDFWFDFTVGIWKTYNGSAWVDSQSVLIGFAILDSTKCIATKSLDFYKAFSAVNTVGLEVQSNTVMQSQGYAAVVNAYGNSYKAGSVGKFVWDSATMMDTGALAASKTYYLYIKDSGSPVISLIPPMDRRADLQGWYHPSKPWRCVGSAVTDGSTHFTNAQTVLPNLFIDVNNGSGTITGDTTSHQILGGTVHQFLGGPVRVEIAPLAAHTGTFVSATSASRVVTLTLARDAVTIASWTVGNTGAIPVSLCFTDQNPGAGLHAYTLSVQLANSADSFSYSNLQMTMHDIAQGDARA